MASSVGEAIGLGLERGLRISGGLRQQRRQAELDEQERQDRALRLEDRQLGLADRQRGIQRQVEEDARRRTAEGLAALDAQIAESQAGLATMTDPNAPDTIRATRRHEGLKAERGRRVQGLSGYDPQAEEREFAGYADAIRQGRGDTLTPKQRVQGMAALGINLADYRRGADGAPSRVGAAIEDVRGGLAQGGDPSMLTRGANVLLAGRLRQGVGQPSPHGGTIVGKEVMQFVPVPGSTPEDPKMAAHLRVWVKGPEPKTAEEKRLLARWRAANPTAPEGATGVYFAPATQGAGTGDGDLVSTFSMGKGFEYLDAQRQLEEWANDPAVAADIDAGVGQWNPQRFFEARGGRKLSTKETALPADGAVLLRTTDAAGNEVRREIVTSPTSKRNPELEAARTQVAQAQISALAALTNLRNTRATGGSSKEDIASARLHISVLTQLRTATSNNVRDLVKQMETATSVEKKKLQPQLDAAREEDAALRKQIADLERATRPGGAGLGDADATSPPPAPKPGGGKPAAAGKPTVSNW